MFTAHLLLFVIGTLVAPDDPARLKSPQLVVEIDTRTGEYVTRVKS